MKVDLNAKELEILDAALVAWQNQPASDGFGKSLMGVMLRGVMRKAEASEEEIEQERAESQAEMQRTQDEAKSRGRQVLLLRAKLCQASAIESEHVVPA